MYFYNYYSPFSANYLKFVSKPVIASLRNDPAPTLCQLQFYEQINKFSKKETRQHGASTIQLLRKQFTA